jgi:hypothetical protein
VVAADKYKRWPDTAPPPLEPIFEVVPAGMDRQNGPVFMHSVRACVDEPSWLHLQRLSHTWSVGQRGRGPRPGVMLTSDGHAAPVLLALVGYAEHSVARILCVQGSCGSANNERPAPHQ